MFDTQASGPGRAESIVGDPPTTARAVAAPATVVVARRFPFGRQKHVAAERTGPRFVPLIRGALRTLRVAERLLFVNDVDRHRFAAPGTRPTHPVNGRSEEHTSELQSQSNLIS